MCETFPAYSLIHSFINLFSSVYCFTLCQVPDHSETFHGNSGHELGIRPEYNSSRLQDTPTLLRGIKQKSIGTGDVKANTQGETLALLFPDGGR